MAKKKETLQEINQPPANKLTAAMNNSNKQTAGPAAVTKPSAPQISIPEIIRNEKGGVIGIKTPYGNTITGSQEQMRAMAGVYAAQQAPIPGTVEQTAVKAQMAADQAQQAMQAQQAQMFQEQAPGAPNLTPLNNSSLQAKLPIIGSSIAAAGTVFAEIANKIPGLKGTTQEPRQLRTAALTAIEKKVYKQGTNANEKTGALIEAIPVVGSLASKYARGFVDTPSGSVNDLVSQINQEVRRADKYRQYSKQGVISPEVAFQNIEDIELNVQKLESKIRLLSNQSALLRANPENLNLIQTKILRSKELLLQSKMAAAAGTTAEADDYAILSALEDLE